MFFWGQIRGHKIKKRLKKTLETLIYNGSSSWARTKDPLINSHAFYFLKPLFSP
jgi:hypothetical protein